MARPLSFQLFTMSTDYGLETFAFFINEPFAGFGIALRLCLLLSDSDHILGLMPAALQGNLTLAQLVNKFNVRRSYIRLKRNRSLLT
jgi:hypothetical protein